MSKIHVIDHVSTEITNEADPTDTWSRDSTAESHYIEGISILNSQNSYGEVECSFDLKPNTYYYLLYYTYDTGDSFGHDSGMIDFVALYANEKLALKCAAIMDASAKAGKTQAPIWNEDGTAYSEYLSGVNDYFGSYNGAEVKAVQLI